LKQKIKSKKGNGTTTSTSTSSTSTPAQKARIRFEVGGPYNFFGNLYTETQYDGKDDFIKPVIVAVANGKMKSANFILGGKTCSRRASHEVNEVMPSGRPNWKEPGKVWPWGCQPFINVKEASEIEVPTCMGIIPDVVNASRKYINETKKAGGKVYPKSVSFH
jgi:hypothetical protein